MSPGSTPPPDRAPGGRSLGFTLVEILVALVIVALISGVLLSAFERVLDVRTRLATFLDGAEAPTLVADWFRSSVDGMIGDSEHGAARFAGNSRRMTALSVMPLDAPAGVPVAITWEVVFDPQAGRTYLRYRNGDDRPMTIASWPGDHGGLRYCGDDRSCHDAWPASKDSPQMPAMVRLDAIKGSEEWPILAAPQARREPATGPSEQL